MKTIDLATLADKCVINLCDGRNLGCVCDIRFTCDEGKICAIIVPKEQGIFTFGKCENIVIPWDKVECIGEDAILVRISVSECCDDACCDKGRGKKHFLFR